MFSGFFVGDVAFLTDGILATPVAINWTCCEICKCKKLCTSFGEDLSWKCCDYFEKICPCCKGNHREVPNTCQYYEAESQNIEMTIVTIPTEAYKKCGQKSLQLLLFRLLRNFVSFNDHAGLFIGRYSFDHNSQAAAAREVFKPSTVSASLLVPTKNYFSVLGLGYSWGDVTSGGVLAFLWPT